MKYHILTPAGDAEDYINVFREFVRMMTESHYFVKVPEEIDSRYEVSYKAITDNAEHAEFLDNVSMFDWISVCTVDDEDACTAIIEEMKAR